MWLLRTLLLTAVVVAFVWVAIENTALVDVDLFGYQLSQIRLFLVMFGSALLGFILGLFVSAYRELKLRLQLGAERKERSLLEREVTGLRAAPIEGLGDEDEPLPPVSSS